MNGEGLSASVPYPNFTVTYDTISKTVTNGGSILVPYTNVYVSAELEGYQVTNTSITADSASKSVTISFKEQQLGVFIYSHSGYELVPIDEYSDSVNDCHGIAICTPETSFVMAYDYWYHEGSRSPNFKDGDNGAWCGHNESSYGGNNYSIPNLPSYSGLYHADYETILNTVPERNGMKETDTIIKGLFGVTTSDSSGNHMVTGSPAAEFCKVYSGIPGFEQVDRGLWHMPNIVEMQAIINNKDEINRALTKLLGTSWMADPGRWNYMTSTTRNDLYYWGYHRTSNLPSDEYRYYGACVIPCRPLYDTNWNPDDHIEIITFTINGDHYYFAEKGMTWIDWINSKYNVEKTTEQGLLGNHSLSAYQYNEQAGLYAKIQNGSGYLIIDENVNDEIYRWDFDANQVASIPGKV